MPRGVAVFRDGAHGERIAVSAHANRETELIAFRGLLSDGFFAGVGCFDVGLLAPGCAGAREDVDRASLRNRLVSLVAVDAFGRAGLEVRRNSQRIAVLAQRNHVSESIAQSWIGRLDVGLLAPGAVLLSEDVDRAGAVNGIIVLVAVDALGAAALIGSAYSQRAAIAAKRDAVAIQRSAVSEMVIRLGVRRFKIGNLFQTRCRRRGAAPSAFAPCRA